MIHKKTKQNIKQDSWNICIAALILQTSWNNRSRLYIYGFAANEFWRFNEAEMQSRLWACN